MGFKDKLKIKSDKKYKVEGNKLIFKKFDYSESIDSLDKIKYLLKKNESFYNFLKYLISPVYFDNSLNKFINQYVKDDNICLNLGSGNFRISKNIINVDIVAYNNVDIVCDIEDLPFEDNSIDIIFNLSVLEHLPNPNKVVKEIHRILKPNGIIYSDIPFMMGFHASPFDYYRWSYKGIQELHKEFTPMEIKQSGGPTSALLWIFQEWISILFSLGSEKLHNIIYIFIMLLTFPLKFLDILLNKFSTSKNIASSFIFIGKKNG